MDMQKIRRVNKISTRLCLPIIGVLLLAVTVSVSAQKTAAESAPVPRRVIFTVVENQPEFPGGTKALQDYIADNLKFPDGLDKKLRNRRIFSRFIITETGSIDSVGVLKPTNDLLDAEVIRVIKNMPAWSPGKQGGHAVAVWYNIPVQFSGN